MRPKPYRGSDLHTVSFRSIQGQLHVTSYGVVMLINPLDVMRGVERNR
jgi:hypothetical protein